MAVRFNRQVEAELDDIWLYIAVEVAASKLLIVSSKQLLTHFFSCQNIQTLAGAVTTSAKACGVSMPAATL